MERRRKPERLGLEADFSPRGREGKKRFFLISDFSFKRILLKFK
jgi:hypothetical protein